MGIYIFNIFFLFLILSPSETWSTSRGDLALPILPPADVYGDVFIDRVSTKNEVVPVVFSHWVHRAKYTCRVCHYELEFSMRAEETQTLCKGGEISGRYCTACHNGKEAFAPKDAEGENCKKCHNADSSPNREKFSELKSKLPPDKFGNEINWAKALNDGLITPKYSIEGSKRSIVLDKTLTLRAEMTGISPGIFPHKAHEQWLDCSNCHPEIFNIKKKSTENLRKVNMLRGESCGLCHLRVAFPLNDCKRCHPRMRGR